MITSSPQLFARPGSSSCIWVITLPAGSRVRLWFDALKMNGDSIIIRDGNDSSAPKIVIIKDDKYKEAIVSTGNNMYLFYKHNGHWRNGTRRGFTASYRTESKLEFLTIIITIIISYRASKAWFSLVLICRKQKALLINALLRLRMLLAFVLASLVKTRL